MSASHWFPKPVSQDLGIQSRFLGGRPLGTKQGPRRKLSGCNSGPKSSLELNLMDHFSPNASFYTLKFCLGIASGEKNCRLLGSSVSLKSTALAKEPQQDTGPPGRPCAPKDVDDNPQMAEGAASCPATTLFCPTSGQPAVTLDLTKTDKRGQGFRGKLTWHSSCHGICRNTGMESPGR